MADAGSAVDQNENPKVTAPSDDNVKNNSGPTTSSGPASRRWPSFSEGGDDLASSYENSQVKSQPKNSKNTVFDDAFTSLQTQENPLADKYSNLCDSKIEKLREVAELQKRLAAIQAEVASIDKATKTTKGEIIAEKKVLDKGLTRLSLLDADAILESLNPKQVRFKVKRDKPEEEDDEVTVEELLAIPAGNWSKIKVFSVLSHLIAENNKAWHESIKRAVKPLFDTCNELVRQHNSKVELVSTDFQKSKSYAEAASKNTKKQSQLIKSEVLKTVKSVLTKKDQEDLKHQHELKTTTRQVVVTRHEEVPGLSGTEDNKTTMEKERNHFVEFVNDLFKDYKRKKNGHKAPHIHKNQIERLKRINWPVNSPGQKKKFPRRLIVTFNKGQEDTVFELLTAMDDMVLTRNREIRAQKCDESQRIHRYLRTSLSNLQNSKRAEMQKECNKLNAENRAKNNGKKPDKVWLVFYDLSGNPFKTYTSDLHPTRTAELIPHWDVQEKKDLKRNPDNPRYQPKESGKPAKTSKNQKTQNRVTQKGPKNKNVKMSEADYALLERVNALKKVVPDLEDRLGSLFGPTSGSAVNSSSSSSSSASQGASVTTPTSNQQVTAQGPSQSTM